MNLKKHIFLKFSQNISALIAREFLVFIWNQSRFWNFDKVFVVICHSCLEPNPLSVILVHFWHVRATNSITPVTLIYNFNIRISILSTQPRKHDNYNPRELAWLTFSRINLRFMICIFTWVGKSLYRGCIIYSPFTGPKTGLIINLNWSSNQYNTFCYFQKKVWVWHV